MPIGINSPARNLFLLGSSGVQVVTNFFKTVDQSSSSYTNFLPEEIKYYETPSEEDRYILSGSGLDPNKGNETFGWFETREQNGTATQENRVLSTDGSNVTLRALELDSNNNILVCGKVGTFPWIAKYDLNGTVQWQSTSNSGNVRYLGVSSDSSGTYYACGRTALSIGVPTDTRSFIESFDSSGQPTWGKSAYMVGRDVVLSAIDNNERNQVVAVGSLNDDSGEKGYIVKMDTLTGEVLWDRTLETPGLNVECTDVFIDGNDQIYITANVTKIQTPLERKGCLLKYTAEGNLLWQTESANVGFDLVEFNRVTADTETGSIAVFGFYEDYSDSQNEYGLLTKYTSSGDLVWRRTLKSNNINPPAAQSLFSVAGIDADPSYYYLFYRTEADNFGGGVPDEYTFAKLSNSGNGLGDFQYATGKGLETVDYVYSTIADRQAKLSDGSVRQDTSDLQTYPFVANKILFDDLATKLTNKKRQMDSADSFQYSGSPSIRPSDFSDIDARWWQGFDTLEEVGAVYERFASAPYEISSGNRLIDPTYRLDGRTEFTIEAWVNFDSFSSQPTSQGYIFDQSPGASGGALRVDDNTDFFTFFVYQEPAGTGVTLTTGTVQLTTNQWYHVVGVFDANNGTSDVVKLYVDGELDNSSNGATTACRELQGDVPLTIGSSASSEEAPAGEIEFTSAGQYEFTVPAGVSSMNMVLVGGGGGGATSTTTSNGTSGGGGGGGALMWRNGLTVSAGDTLYITVGAAGQGGTMNVSANAGNDDATDGGDSYVRTGSHTGTIVARAGGGGAGPYNEGNTSILPVNGGVEYSSTYGGGGSNSGGGDGGRGGRGQSGHQCGGGGGAGGYSGNGGSGSDGSNSNATAGTGGAGGGGGGSNSTGTFDTIHGGGGVGIYGEGASGAAGVSQTGSTAGALAGTQGEAGSGGTSTDPTTNPLEKGYGGGGQGTEDDADGDAADGAGGAVRLVWGTGRSFPTTSVGKDEIPGGVDNREYMDGSIGEVRVYPRALTSAEVYQNYNASRVKYTGVQARTNPFLNTKGEIVSGSNLLLNYDFSNGACSEKSVLVVPESQEIIVDDATTNGAAFGDGQCVATGYGKVVVGARGETNGVYTAGGKAYIYNASTGALEVTLSPSDISGNDWNFGNAVAICNCSGRIAVTSSSALYLYDADGTNEVIINDQTTLPIQPPGGNTFGNGLAIDGNRVWVSDDNVPQGPLYSGTVFCFNAETGAFIYELRPNNEFDNFIRYGTRIAAGDGVLAIGAESIEHPVTGRSLTGRVYLYTLDGRNEKILEPDDLTTSALFGTGGLAIGYGMIIVGASRQARVEDPQKIGSGAVYVFDMNGDYKYPTPPGAPRGIRPSNDPADEDADYMGFGDTVAISSDRIIIGARNYVGNPGGVAGQAYLFDHTGYEWQRWIGTGGVDASDFGSSMDSSGGVLVIGAGGGSPDASGRAYIYPLTATPSGNIINLANPGVYTGILNTFPAGGALPTLNGDGSFQFDGTDDFIDTGLSWTPANQFSFTMWFNLDTIKEWHNLVDMYVNNTNRNFQLFVEGDGDFRIYWGTTSGTSAITGTVANEWYFGAFTCDGESGILYRYGNGTTDSVSATAAAGTYSVQPVLLGRRGDGSANGFVDGRIGEFQFYNTELSSSQILQNYNATRGKYGV